MNALLKRLTSLIGTSFYVAHAKELSEFYARRLDNGRHRGGTAWQGYALVVAISLPASWVSNLSQKIWYFPDEE